MSSETLLLENIRQLNDGRAADSREWVGGIFFLLACGMVTFCIILGFTQTYVISLKSCNRYLHGLNDVKENTTFLIFFFVIFYFVVTIFGGMTGWIVSSSILGTWWLILLMVGVIRRIKHRRDTKAALKKAAEEDDRMAKQIASGVFDPDALDFGRNSRSSLGGGGGGANDAAFGSMVGDQSSGNFASSDFKSHGHSKGGSNPVQQNDSTHLGAELGALNASMDSDEEGNLGGSGDEARRQSVKFGTGNESPDKPKAPMKSIGSKKNMGGARRGSGVRGSGVGGSFFGLSRKESAVFDPQAFARRNQLKKDEWATSPDAMAPAQRSLTACTVVLFILILVCMWILLLSWKVSDYHYLGLSGQSTAEVVPVETAQAIQMIYAFPNIATRFQLDLYVKLFTEYCHDRFTKTLSDDEKEADIYEDWVFAFGINMSEYVEPDWRKYESVNKWLIRPIVLSNRPAPVSADAITSPVDGRTLIYVIQEDLRIWLKGTKITYADLLGGLPLGGTSQYFNNGAAVISRLALQDYHRFHAPVAGTVLSITPISGTLWSVGPDASFSENDVLLNNRVVIVIDGGIRIGRVAVIAVGATCVGSIQLETSTAPLVEGAYVERGEQMGWIQFGGSTVVTLFSQGRILWDSSIIYRSRFPVETEVLMNQQLGSVRP